MTQINFLGRQLGVPAEVSIPNLLRVRAEKTPDAVAIRALLRPPLTYSRLHAHVEQVAGVLSAIGVGRNDRVAIVLPNGPEMAVAFLAVASQGTSAPLNPAYSAGEFEFYLSDLQARAVIVESGLGSHVRPVAEALGIPTVELIPAPDLEAGIFRLAGSESLVTHHFGRSQAEDVALVLHTSGTTSRPKVVPLTHRNLCFSAHSTAIVLQLEATDICLNVMPLFHVHGLIGALLSSLMAGAGIVCTPGFHAPRFFDWLEEFHPTWYTAVPTMHQGILARAEAGRGNGARPLLRFIRSCSAPLPVKVMADLESVFRAPVIEAYGMTEASHQMTSNPLPPLPRKPGSVGKPAGPEVAVMNEAGCVLAAGERGEIVIRGDGVTCGYERNAEANQRAFVDGWFRTGDEGHLDNDGYLFITGRLKEIINRGGEKIMPREIDEVLLDHPAVAQATTFAIPDKLLGEDVGAAVVLRTPGITEQELRRFAAQRLAYFKVPRLIVFLDEIPKGPTGKIQRIGLAEQLGLMTGPEAAVPDSGEFVAPRTQVEEIVAEIWCEVLNLPVPSVNQRFLDLGGDSVQAARVVARLRQRLGIDLSLLDFFEAPTIAGQAIQVQTRLLQQDASEGV